MVIFFTFHFFWKVENSKKLAFIKYAVLYAEFFHRTIPGFVKRRKTHADSARTWVKKKKKKSDACRTSYLQRSCSIQPGTFLVKNINFFIKKLASYFLFPDPGTILHLVHEKSNSMYGPVRFDYCILLCIDGSWSQTPMILLASKTHSVIEILHSAYSRKSRDLTRWKWRGWKSRKPVSRATEKQ